MTKTPEQMALEYAHTAQIFWDGEPIEHHIVVCKEMAFLAGYQAAKDQLQPQPFYKGADVYIIDANNPLPKPMPLSIAEQDQLADTSKVMNSPEKLDSWISVKERLPETNELCIVNTEWRGIVPATYGNESWIFDEGQGWSEKALSYASHWMPLPEAPKGEG